MFKPLLMLATLSAFVPDAAARPLVLGAEPDLRVPSYVPYGNVTGAWSSASVLADGFVNGLVSDAAGQPLWVLDATLTAGHQIQGALHPLEYAGNPVMKLGSLAVTGSAQMAAGEGGGFHLVMYDPQAASQSGAGLTIYALGFIQGELVLGRSGGALPVVAAGGHVAAGHQAPSAAVGTLGARWFLIF